MKKIVLTKKLLFLYKFSIVAGLGSIFCVAFILPLFVVLGFFEGVENEILYTICVIFLCIFMASGLWVFIFPFVIEDTNGITNQRVIPYKYSVKVSSFSDFIIKTEETVTKKDYFKIGNISYEDYEMYLFAKPHNILNSNLLLIIRTDELTEEIIEKSNESFRTLILSYYNKDCSEISNHTTIMTMVCVNRITNYFPKVFNSNLAFQQDFSIYRLIAGLSFGGKKLYIAKQKSGLAVAKFNKNKKDFLELFDFLIENDLSKTK